MSSCHASLIGQDTSVTNTNVPVGRTICKAKESEDQKNEYASVRIKKTTDIQFYLYMIINHDL